MGKYTQSDLPAADLVVERELNTITNELVANHQGVVHAILLVGGFGRGEGAVVEDNGRLRAVNDYDLVVVCKGPKSARLNYERSARRIVAELEGRLGVKQIDVLVVGPYFLAIPVPSVARYEIRNGHKLLYGRLPFKIRSFPARLLPLYEGTRYFRTRASGLVIARLILDSAWMPARERLEFAFLEINKAILAMGDAYLLRNRCYHFSYSKRREVFSQRWRKFNMPRDIAAAYLDALAEKLTMNLERLHRMDMDNEWHVVVTRLIREFLKFESARYGSLFQTLAEYDRFMSERIFSARSLIAKIERLLIREDRPQSVRYRLTAMMLLESRISADTESLGSAATMLGRSLQDRLAWEGVARDFLSDWHPNGIVSRLLVKESEAPVRDG